MMVVVVMWVGDASDGASSDGVGVWWWWWWCVTRMVMVMVVVVVMVVVWEGIGLCTSLCVFDAWHAC